jgi:hypothetical protein
MNATHWIAAAVVITVATSMIWTLKSHAEQWRKQMYDIWTLPWGKTVVIDSFGIEIVLAMFMISHAAGAGSWFVLVPCLVLMPLLGAIPAGLYWLIAVA